MDTLPDDFEYIVICEGPGYEQRAYDFEEEAMSAVAELSEIYETVYYQGPRFKGGII